MLIENLFVGLVEFFELADFVDELFAGEQRALFFILKLESQLLSFFESLLINSLVGFALEVVAVDFALVDLRDLAVEVIQIVLVLFGDILERIFLRIFSILFIFHHIIL